MLKVKTTTPTSAKATAGRQNSKLWITIGGLLLVVLGAQLLVSNILSVRGGELAELEKEATVLSRNNQLIKQEVAQYGSLSKIALSAESLGMVKPESLLYIDVGQAVASLPTVQ